MSAAPPISGAPAPPELSSLNPSITSSSPSKPQSPWANRYRGATVEDLDPPPALSCHPTDRISHALLAAFERDYTHLTVVAQSNRALLGYLSIPRLRALLAAGRVAESDEVAAAMVKFRRKGRVYRIITMDTPLEELEEFFAGGGSSNVGGTAGGTDGGTVDDAAVGAKTPQEFAVVTDASRRFVLGVATAKDLEEFARRRPA